MGEAAFWGAVGASALVVGAEVTFGFKLSRMVIGLIMAFGVGALISSVSFELVVPAMQDAETWQVALGLALGSLTFFAGDRAIARMGSKGKDRKDPPDESDDGDGEDDEGGSLGIVLGTVLDGVPESAVLGMSLVGGAGVSISLLAGIWISNFPESLGSSVNLVASGWSKTKIRLLWWAIVAVSAVSAGLGFVVVDNSSTLSGVLIESFAAGALLTMIADEMAPEAYDRGKIYAGLMTVAGFALALWLTSLE
ncbi:MAG: ZIP family zinc transporter [Acidimicrobiia bacterium]|nr:ZIP family zinc transporter [Acidimicrobiia bacterium]